MKIKGLIVLTCVIALMLGSCGKSSLTKSNLRNQEDSLAYAFGIVNYNALKSDSLSSIHRLLLKQWLMEKLAKL